MPIRSLLMGREFAAFAAALLVGTAVASAAPLYALDGILHERNSQLGLFPAPIQSGRFSLYADADLRAVVLETDAGGRLLALAPESPRRLMPPRRDPETGFTLRPDAPEDAVCATGYEPDCWRPGDPPLPIEDVVDALCAAVGAEPDACRFRDDLGRAPFPVFTSVDTAPWLESFEFESSWSGIDLLNAEASVTMQSFVGISGNYSGEAAVQLPGARSPFLADGTSVDPDTTGGLAIPAPFGAPAGQQFVSEMAALSFNLQMILVASQAANPDTPRSDEFDPTAPFAVWDPADPATDANRGRCSFLQPQFCSSVQAFFTIQEARLRALLGDPSVTPHERWIWEAGAELEIAAAGGDLGRFDGGKLFALGPEHSRVQAPTDSRGGVGVTFLLVGDDPSETPQVFFAAPEPLAGAQAAAALLALVALSRRRGWGSSRTAGANGS